MPLGGGVGRLDEELTAHAEVSEQRVAVVERQPEVLAPPAGALDPATGQRGGEALRAARVAAHGPRVQHLDAGDGAAHRVPLEAHAHHFDLGQLGHQSAASAAASAAALAAGSGTSRAGASSPYAVSAAPCSASFLDRPTPLP